MSRLNIVSYRDREAERRRAEQRELRQLERELVRCAQLEHRLAQLEDSSTSDASDLLSRIRTDAASLSAKERQSWLERAPHEAAQLEGAIAAAHEKRIRFEFAAASLMRSANEVDRPRLAEMLTSARGANRVEFANMRRDMEAITTTLILRAAQKPGAAQLSDDGRRLADALMTAFKAPDARLPSPEPDPIDPRIGQLISDLAALGKVGEPLLTRARELIVNSEGSLDLKLDSLSLEASEYRAKLLRRRTNQEGIQNALDSLAPFDDPSSAALRAKLAAVDPDAANTLSSLLHEVETHASSRARDADGANTRKALIDGLLELGYEVHLQDETWQPGRRIAAQRSTEPNYDIQLAATADGRIQSKVRAFAHPGRSTGSNARDVEVEERWCTDLRSLNNWLETVGIDPVLEHEEAPGSAAAIAIERSANMTTTGTERRTIVRRKTL